MCRLLHKAILFLLAALPTSVWAQGGIDFHPIEGQTYVIMNAETGEFLYRKVSYKTSYVFMTNSYNSGETLADLKNDPTTLLWGIQPNASMNFSYFIYNKHNGNKYYLTVKDYTANFTKYWYYLLNATDSTQESPFYFIRSEYNRDGYKVSSNPNFSDSLWYCTHSKMSPAGYYLYDTYSDGLSMTKASSISEGDPKYDLSSFRFFTYDDLWNKYIKIKNDTVNGHCLAGGGYTPLC